MSKIKLTGSNSGYVEISSAADAGNLTLNLPTSGTALLSNAGNVFSGITTFTGLNITDDVTLNGGSYDVVWDASDNQLEFGDNAKLSFGASSDLQLYHDGTRSHILNNTDELRIRGNDVRLMNAAGNEHYFVGFANNYSAMYYDNSQRIKTESSGVTVTGTVAATSFSGSGEGLTRTTQLSHRNLIVNGAMQVAQRGTSSTSDGYQTVDRYQAGWNGGGVTQSQADVGSSDTPYTLGFRKTFKLTNTSTATGASNYRDIRHYVEAQDIANSGWDLSSPSSNITLSFWVKASVAQTYYFFIYAPDSSKHYTTSFSLSADTWTKVIKNIPGSSGLSVNNDNGNGLNIQIAPFYGTNFTTSGQAVDTWGTWSGSSRVPDMTNTWANTSNSTFEITGLQLEVGSQATPFEHRSFREELSRCQRYFVKTDFSSHATAYFGGTHLFRQIPFHCPTPMRAQPSFSLSGAESGTVKFTLKTWSSDQNMTATPNAIHMYHTDYVHGTNNSAVHSLGLGIDYASSNSGVPPNGPGNHNVYSCRVYGAEFDAEL